MPVGAIPAQTLEVGETLRLDVTSYFRDPDGGSLTYTAASLAPGVVSVSQLGAVLTMVGVAEGTATVTVTATDPGGLSAAQNVGVTVFTPNQAPEAVGSIPAQNLDAGETVTLEVSGYFRDPDGDALTYTAATSAAGVVSVSISGSRLTVVGVAEGRATVTVTAADPGGLTAAQSAAVGVQRPNRAPEAVGSIPGQNLDAGDRVTLEVSGYFRDPDGDALTYTAATSNAGVVSVSISGSTVTMVGVAAGRATVTVTAADPGGLTAVQSAAVAVQRPNRAPEAVGPIPAQSLAPGRTVTLDVTGYFRDPDGDALTYTAATSNAGVASVSISGSSLTVTGVGEGRATVTVTATDPDGLTAVQSAAVAVQRPNRAPEAVGSIPAQSLDLGQSRAIDVSSYFRDPDGDALTYAVATSNALATASVSGSRVTVTGVAVGSATVTVTASDPLGLSASQTIAVTVQRSNRAPEAVGSIPAQSLDAGGRRTLDVTGYFRDPDGDALTYTAATSNAGVASVSMSGGRLTVVGIRAGSANVQVTAADPAGLTAMQNVGVTVRSRTGGGYGDGFDGPASLDDWEIHNADAEVVGGVLQLTNRVSGSLGVAERASPLMLNQWSVSARVGRATRQASPGVASLTGHRRFSAARLVLRTLDNGGDADRSADVAGTMEVTGPGGVAANVAAAVSASGGTGTNYELALFDADRGWVQITNLSGRSDAVDERPDAFTDIELGLDSGDFVAHARRVETGEGETLFRVSLDATVDNVRLGDFLGRMDGLWLVNRGPVNTTIHVDDVVVNGAPTSNRAPVPVGSIPAQSLNPGQSRTVDVSGYFRDPDGDALTYLTSSSNPAVATATMSRSGVTVTGVAAGSATVTVRATDPGGLSATQTIAVTVQAGNTDRSALEAFYEAAGGSNWTNNDGWLTDAPLGDWYGVQTDSQGRVTALTLVGNNLRGEISPELGNLGNVVTLHFDGHGDPGNELRGEIPPELGNLTALEAFRAPFNELTGEIPPELGNLGNLRDLNVQANRLTGEIPPELGNLSNLVLLIANSNELTGEIPPELGGLANLRTLWLGRSKLTGEIPPELGSLTRLESLYLFENELTGQIPPELGNLSNLQSLSLYENNLTGEIPPELGDLASLEHLSLFDNELSGRLPDSFLNLELTLFWWYRNAGLCALDTSAFRTWMAEIGDHRPGPFCGENRPPEVVTGLRIINLSVGHSSAHDMTPRHFRDPDGDTLTFTAVSRNPDIVKGSMTGSIVTVTGVAPGEGLVAVTATDPGGLTATLDVEVMVIEAENRPPEAVGTIPPQTLEPDGETSLNVSSYFRDPDGDPLTYTASSSDNAVVEASMWANDNRLLVLNAGVPGTATVTVTASDPGGLTAIQTVEVVVASAQVTRLTSNSATDYSPAWSPDGAQIAFTSDRDGNSEIYVMNTRGGGVTRLTNHSRHDIRPSWSPDGAWIAFESERHGNREIYVMNADGGEVTRLTDHSAFDYSPAWSPDSTRIAFVSDRDGNREIYVMNADGSGVMRLTSNSVLDDGPSWSPDGTRIAFSSSGAGGREIHVMNSDGSGIAARLTDRSRDGNPAWSPDGGRIAFNSQRDGNYEIYVMNSDGSGVTRLTNSTALDLNPSWSPDGTRISFESERDGNREIYVMNVPAADDSASLPPR